MNEFTQVERDEFSEFIQWAKWNILGFHWRASTINDSLQIANQAKETLANRNLISDKIIVRKDVLDHFRSLSEEEKQRKQMKLPLDKYQELFTAMKDRDMDSALMKKMKAAGIDPFGKVKVVCEEDCIMVYEKWG